MLFEFENIERLKRKIKQLEVKCNQGKGKLSLLYSQRKDLKNNLDQTLINLQDWELVQILFSSTSEFAREQLKKKIESTVTAALQSIINDSDLRFQVVINIKGGQPVADWMVLTPIGNELVPLSPEDAKGGGVSDVVSFALRLALLELVDPKNEGFLVADEPGRNVSKEYGENFALFIAEYSQKTGRQVIMSSHREDQINAAARRYDVIREENGTAKVVLV